MIDLQPICDRLDDISAQLARLVELLEVAEARSVTGVLDTTPEPVRILYDLPRGSDAEYED